MNSHEPANDDGRQLWRRIDGALPREPSACVSPLELAGFADDRLSDQDRQAVEGHLADCGACREALLDIAGADREARAFVPPSVIDAAKGLVGRSRDDAGRWILGTIGALGAAAASIAICFVGYRVGSAWYGPDEILAEEALLSEMSFGLLASGEPDLDLLADAFEEMTP